MPRKKTDADLLDSAESIEDFILLLASGISPNCQLKDGTSLTESYYGSLTRAKHNISSYNIMLEKLKILLSAGADVTTIFQTTYRNFHFQTDFTQTLDILENQLILLELLFESEQARQWLANEPFYHKSLERIKGRMARVASKLQTIYI